MELEPRNHMKLPIRWLLHPIAAAGVILVIGTLLHEGGHALAGAVAGAQIDAFVVLGLRLYPSLEWVPSEGLFGYVSYDRALAGDARAWMQIAGSAATWAVALLALWTWRWPSRTERWTTARSAHLAGCFLWVDVFCHSLPYVGMPMYLAFGRSVRDAGTSELVFGATQLGLNEYWVLAAVFAQPPLALWVLVRRLKMRRGDDAQTRTA